MFLQPLSLLIAVPLLLLPLVASAQSSERLGEMLANADTNHDGRIDRGEFIAARARMFPALDRNHDDQLETSELQGMGGQAARFAGMAVKRADGNGDGRLSLAEFNAMPVRAFDKLDRNGDGVLDANEIDAARAKAAQMASRRSAPGAG
jgi:Ca2+-binding EF-hand superfamily protein